jgi:hypothetical protein
MHLSLRGIEVDNMNSKTILVHTYEITFLQLNINNFDFAHVIIHCNNGNC